MQLAGNGIVYSGLKMMQTAHSRKDVVNRVQDAESLVNSLEQVLQQVQCQVP